METNIASSFAVIVPSFRRPEWLLRCINAILRQELRPARVIVAIKHGDELSANLVQNIRGTAAGAIVQVAVSPASANVVGQQNAALASTTEDFVALTDDDAEPHVDWLAKIRPHFDDSEVVGVGGRDWQPHERSNAEKVGQLSWFGRVTGNHHLGSGPARDVDVLKGVNCCFRGDALRKKGFDPRMRGKGTVIHWELALCLTLRRDGWRLIYDPQVAVDHHVAPREDDDTNDRGVFDRATFVDIVHNETLATLEALPPSRRWIYRLWREAIGTIAVPGVLQVPRRFVLKREPLASTVQRFWAAREGMSLAQATLHDPAAVASHFQDGTSVAGEADTHSRIRPIL